MSLVGDFADFEPPNGSTKGRHCQFLDDTMPWIEYRHCTFDLKALSSLSYQAVFQAAIDTPLGRVELASTSAIGFTSAMIGDSSVRSTILAQSPELAFLKHPVKYDGDAEPSLQDIALSANHTILTSLDAPPSSQGSLPLQEAIEQLFQNIMISPTSSPELQ